MQFLPDHFLTLLTDLIHFHLQAPPLKQRRMKLQIGSNKCISPFLHKFFQVLVGAP
jgi:hypothetical protein